VENRAAGHGDPKQRIDVITEDPSDNRILECAAASGSDYLVSGDKHLLKVGQYQRFKIVPPAEFIGIQSQQGRAR
jgi:predicted nucleic acid-binding protein